jgi:hypothetical protein
MTRLAGRRKRPPIAPSVCRPRPPAAGGHATALCGIARVVSRIAWSLAAFTSLPLPPQRWRCIYISLTLLPRTTTHSLFHFPLFPSHGAQCTAPFFFQDAASPGNCPFPARRHLHPPRFAPFGFGVPDGLFGRLKPGDLVTHLLDLCVSLLTLFVILPSC